MKCKVWNDHNKEYTEKFQGKDITIPANGFIEMSHSKAVAFLGAWTPPLKTGSGHHTNPKKLRIEYDMQARLEKLKQPGIVCMACNEVLNNAVDYDVHVKTMHSAIIHDKEALEKKKDDRKNKR